MVQTKTNTLRKAEKKTQFTSFAQMLQLLPDEKACREFLEYIKWNGAPICPHCGSVSESHYKITRKGVFKGWYKCRDCKQQFSVCVGTMFEGSHIPLRKWFIAMYIFSAHKKGVSSHQLARDLDITQKSAWFIISRLRINYEDENCPDLGKAVEVKLVGETKCDETFVGGKNKNRHKNKKVKNAQGRSTKDKTPVFGVLNNGKVLMKVIPDTTKETLQGLIDNVVEKGSIITTDDWTGYVDVQNDYEHKVISHTKEIYVVDGHHTNDIEGVWSLLKRGIFGIYHSVSKKHLDKYCNEFAFRYNTREMNDGDRFKLAVARANKRVSYKELIAKK